jgi:hypothetical protein
MRSRRNEQRVEEFVVPIKRIISSQKFNPDRVLAGLGCGNFAGRRLDEN